MIMGEGFFVARIFYNTAPTLPGATRFGQCGMLYVATDLEIPDELNLVPLQYYQ